MMLRKLCSWPPLFLQRFKLYRALGRRLFQRQIRCCIATAAHTHSLSRLFGYGEGTYQGQRYRLIATLNSRIVGAVTIICFHGTSALYPGWWIFGLAVRIPYRGLGIGERLMQEAIEKAALAGATRLNLLVSEKNRGAINLYQKLGLRVYPIPELDAHLEDRFRHTGGREVVMSIPISQGNSLPKSL